MALLTYDQALERLADGRIVEAEDVQTRALRRKVWVYGNGQPGCLYDNGPNYTRTKSEAIEALAELFDEYPGVKTSLRKHHAVTISTGERLSIDVTTLGDVL